eukprot:COSAG01_NODE_817_length_13376_cov_2.970101_16_plen_48_part_00
MYVSSVRGAQMRAVAFLGTVLVGAMIGLFNFISRLLYDDIFGRGTLN